MFTFLSIVLVACGGGSSSNSNDDGNGNGNGNGNGEGSGDVQTELTSTGFERQVYVAKTGLEAVTFLADRTGVLAFSEEPDSIAGVMPFTWDIQDKKLAVAYDDTELGSESWSYKSVSGNEHVFTIDLGTESGDKTYYKAKPLTLADLDGKIFAFDTSNDSDCSARTIKTTGNSVSMKEVCNGGTGDESMMLSSRSDLDNALEFSWTEDNAARTAMMILTEGSVNNTANVAFVMTKDGVITAVEKETLTLTDTEAGDNTAFKFSTDYLNGKTLYNVYEECEEGTRDTSGVCQGSLFWEMSVMSFTGTTVSGYQVLANGQQGESGSGTYSITSEGYISVLFDNEDEVDYVKPIEKASDFIRLDWTSSRDGIRTDRYNEYFFFDQSKATAFIEDQTEPSDPTGTDAFQVINQKLVMKSLATEATPKSVGIRYGLSGSTSDSISFDSFAGDVTLTDDQITGDARARFGLVLKGKSASSADAVQIYMAIDNRSSGTTSRVILTVNGVDTEITEISRQPLQKGTAYNFKIEPLDNDNVRISIGNLAYEIPGTELPDVAITDLYFFTNVKNAQAGDFSKGTLDNVVLELSENDVDKVIIRNFDEYSDGQVPDTDEYFDNVYSAP